MKTAGAEEYIIKNLKQSLRRTDLDGILDCWYDMTARKARVNAGDWCEGEVIQKVKDMLINGGWVDAEADIELLDEAGGPGAGDWVKVAASGGVDVRESAVHGKGLFATRTFEPGDTLYSEFMRKLPGKDRRDRWEQSEMCRHTNHGDPPNATVRKDKDSTELVALETIAKNEEIRVDYTDVTRTMGRNFYYTYQGKPYGNGEAANYIKASAAAASYGYTKSAATTADIHKRLAAARDKTTEPVSAAVAAAGNYRKGRLKYHGLPVSIENPKGSIRRGVSGRGVAWSTTMKHDYGYIRGTTGADGDPIDVFIGEDPKSELVFVINQVNKDGSFDEHKVVLGAMDTSQARKTYLSNYAAGWSGCGEIVSMTMAQFKEWMQTSKVKKPATAVKVATDYVIGQVLEMGAYMEWRAVPDRICVLLKIASTIRDDVQAAIKDLPIADKGYGHVYWHPHRKNLWAVLSDSDEQETHDAWWGALSKIPGVNKVFTEAEAGPSDEHRDEWVQIKRAGAILDAAGSPFGGPSAATNAIVGALIGGGLGYGGGRLLETLVPERVATRGNLSRSLLLAGAALGSSPGITQGFANMSLNAKAGDPSATRSFFSPLDKQRVRPDAAGLRERALGKPSVPPGTMEGVFGKPKNYSTIGDKLAAYSSGLGNSALPPIRVDRFNNAIWADTQSPPAINAMAAGVVSGVAQQYSTNLLSPSHFIKGLAAAGVDYATARVAGGVLGVLGGMTPAAQKDLQQLGLWSGLIRGTIGSILGR